MRDIGASLAKPGRHSIEHSLHSPPPIKHISGFLVALDVMFDLSLHLAVDLLILDDLS